MTSQPKRPSSFAVVWRDTVEILFNQATGPVTRSRAPGAYDVYVRVTGLEALAAELAKSGGEIIDGPAVRVYGQCELVIRDRNGAVLAFGEPLDS